MVLGARRTIADSAFLAVSDLRLRTDPPAAPRRRRRIRGYTPARDDLAPNALRVMVAPGLPDT